MGNFNKEKFAELLEKAKGKRSINNYALKSGVTSAHISRLLRGLLDTPPMPDTIKKLSDHAHNEVRYNDLMVAAGHFDPEVSENEKALSEEAADIIKMIDSLPKEKRKKAWEHLEMFVNYEKSKEEK